MANMFDKRGLGNNAYDPLRRLRNDATAEVEPLLAPGFLGQEQRLSSNHSSAAALEKELSGNQFRAAPATGTPPWAAPQQPAKNSPEDLWAQVTLLDHAAQHRVKYMDECAMRAMHGWLGMRSETYSAQRMAADCYDMAEVMWAERAKRLAATKE